VKPFLILISVFSLLVSGQAQAQLRTFTIGGETFSEAEIVDARSQPDLAGTAAIMITFSPEGAKRLAILSHDHIGKPMPILLNGKLLAEPVVMEDIAGGVAQISGSFTLAEADALALTISGKEPLADSLDEGP
jgi:preprotein translocase subunit SecD